MPNLLKKREKSELLKNRVKILKERLKGVKNWKSDFFEKNKKYDSHYWSGVMKNMMDGSVTDEGLIIAVEKYADDLLKDKK